MGLTPWAKPQWLQNAAGADMPYEQFLQLAGAGIESLTDDPNNRRTVATLGGGGVAPISTWFANSQQKMCYGNGTAITNGGYQGDWPIGGGTFNWIDANGGITKPGVYLQVLDLIFGNPTGTFAGYIEFNTNFYMDAVVNLSDWAAYATAGPYTQVGTVAAEIFTVTAADITAGQRWSIWQAAEYAGVTIGAGGLKALCGCIPLQQ